VNLLPFKKDIAFLGDRLLGTRAHDTAWTEQQLFLQQCGNAPPARPNDFLRHFFVRPLTILPILDHTTLRPHGRVIVLAFDATERAAAEPLFENSLRPQVKSVPKTLRQKLTSANK
jgi:hypothetical protein